MPRRSDGEGTEITKGADDRWHAWLSFGTKAGGRRERRHVSGTTRKEVVAKLRMLQTKREAGIVPVADVGLTLAQWLRHWLETIAATRVRPGTLYDYRLVIEGRVIPALGHHRLNRLQPEHVEAFYRACMKAQVRKAPATGKRQDVPALSANSVVKIHRVLSRALRVAVHRETCRPQRLHPR